MALEESHGITKLSRFHLLGTMKVCTEFHGNHPTIVEIFQFGQKWWADLAILTALCVWPRTDMKMN